MNYPAAFLWQLCGAGPLVRFVFGKGLAAMKSSEIDFAKHRQKKHKPIFVQIKLHKNHLPYLVIVL